MNSTRPRGPRLNGEYEITLDEKRRILVPSEIRKAFKQAEAKQSFFIVIGTNKVPWLYSVEYYDQMAWQMPTNLLPSVEQLEYEQLSYGAAAEVEWDKQGRILIPSQIMEKVGDTTDLTLVGVRDHLQLWATKVWAAHRNDLESRRDAIIENARRARPGQAEQIQPQVVRQDQ